MRDQNSVKKSEELFHQVIRELNLMGNEAEVQEALENVLRTEHRTLQQNFFRSIVVPTIRLFAQKQKNSDYDLRNEASCQLATKLEKVVEDNPGIPFI